MGHLSLRPKRMPTFVVAPALAVGLLGLPTVDTTPAPEPVQTELDTVELDGVDSAAAAAAEMPDTPVTHDDPAEDDGHGHADGAEHGELEVAATSEPIDTDPYRVVAVTWDDEDVEVDELNAFIRYRSDDGWSDWYPLPSSDGHAPDPGSLEEAGIRQATEPLVVPESDGVQVRVDTEDGVEVDDLRVDLIDPGTSPADATAGTDAASAAQAATQPRIYSRAEWGADESLRGSTVQYGQIQAGFVHHTVNSNSYTASEVPSIIRGIYAFHVKSRGYRDIGYNFLIDKFGRIWEGRYGGISKPVIGAHTYGHNDDAFAASTIGTYTSTEPTQKTLDAYARLFAWKFDMHGVDALSKVNLDGTVVNAISGHRDTYATACPGDRLYAKLPTIRRATDALQTGSVATGSVRISGVPSQLTKGDSFTLAVATTDVPTGTTVRIERSVNGGAWSTVRTGTTSGSGAAEFTLKPNSLRSFGFRAVLDTSPALVSTTATVRVVAADTTTTQPVSYAPRSSDVFSRPSSGTFSITGHGWGHGHGMSQWGARQAATEGAAEREITSFYYPGTTRSTTGANSLVRVLLTADTGYDVIVRPESGLSVQYRAQSGAQRDLVLPSSVDGCRVGWWRARAVSSDISIQALCGESWKTWRGTGSVDGNSPVTFTPSDGMVDVARRLSSGFERKAYRGSIEANRSGSSLRAVNVVRIEQYLRAVVPNEMPSSWPQQALRAQAVAARTYAMREAQDRGGYFDVYDTTASQVYPGARLYNSSWSVVRSYEASSTDSAVSATAGVHLRYGGRPAFTQFSSSNGGVTSQGSQPYLARKSDPWDAAATSNSRLNWTDSVTATRLQNSYSSIGRLLRIRVLEREGLGDWGGRILRMRLEGDRGNVTISGDSRVRSALGTNSSYLTFR
jgi:SpoIID/LytB domain protein